MIQPRDFETLKTFIDHLASKSAIIGILEYGRRSYQDMSGGGDYDLNIIVDSSVESEISGLHFHINGIPVDCGIIKRDDLYLKSSPSDYHYVLLESRVLYDAKGNIGKRLLEIKEEWTWEIASMSEGEIAFERFIKQHIIDKFDKRLYENELYTRLFLSGNIFWLLEDYLKIEGLNPYDFKGGLGYMKEQHPEVYNLFEAFEKTSVLEEKLSITKRLNKEVLKKIGGPWRKNEILFHYADHSQGYSDEAKSYVVNLVF